jgi:hypothetical protein
MVSPLLLAVIEQFYLDCEMIENPSFCYVDDFFQQITEEQRIRRRDFAPSLSDSEVMTMEIVREFQVFTEPFF